VVCAGINHQTWYIKVLHQGKDLTPHVLEAFEKHPEIIKHEKCRVDVLRRTGYFSTETNGHLSEYLPWYRKNPEEVARWADIDDQRPLGGETAGYLRFTIKRRNFLETDMPKWLAEEVKPFTGENRSHEHGSFIIEALETNRLYRGHFNLVNEGRIANLPADAIIEAPGYVDATGIHMPPVGELPDVCAAICNASISTQRLAVKAAVNGDPMLLKQAMMMDPLTAAVCNTPEIWQMVDRLLVAEQKWLPQYRHEIPAAARRLRSEKPLDTHPLYPSTRKPMEVKVEELESMRIDMEDAEIRGDFYQKDAPGNDKNQPG
jgi:alpha-galactosidase